MLKTLYKFLKYGIPSILILLFLWSFILAKSAAMVFNYAMERQDILRGTITVERIEANILGDVEFEDLKWIDDHGGTILHIPEGSFHVRPWDIITWNLKSTTLQELTLKNALVSIHFDDHMNVDFVRHSPDLKKIDDTEPNWEDKVSLAGKSEEERRAIGERRRMRNQQKMENQWQNFNHKGHRFRLKFHLENCLMEIFYKERQYYLSGVYFNTDINSDKSVSLKAYTGRFGGTMIGNGMTIHGDIDLTCEPVPECDLTVLLQDVQPASLGFGLNIQDALTLQTYFTGPISHPVANGTLSMDRLRLPGMEFENVRGDVHYEDAQLDFHDVSAKVYGGTLNAEGDYNIDTRYYHIHGFGKDLRASKAFRGAGLSCPVDMEIYLVSNEQSRDLKCYGSFTSGPGRYEWIPFDKISGRFSNAYRDLRFYDARIDIGHYQLQTDFISIIDGKLTLHPVDLVNMTTGETRMTYIYDKQ